MSDNVQQSQVDEAQVEALKDKIRQAVSEQPFTHEPSWTHLEAAIVAGFRWLLGGAPAKQEPETPLLAAPDNPDAQALADAEASGEMPPNPPDTPRD